MVKKFIKDKELLKLVEELKDTEQKITNTYYTNYENYNKENIIINNLFNKKNDLIEQIKKFIDFNKEISKCCYSCLLYKQSYEGEGDCELGINIFATDICKFYIPNSKLEQKEQGV